MKSIITPSTRKILRISALCTLFSLVVSCTKGVSKATLRQAEAMGNERASRLAPAIVGTDSAAIEMTLLDVRSREFRLRASGQDKVADAYINGFIHTLDSVNPDLAASLH